MRAAVLVLALLLASSAIAQPTPSREVATVDFELATLRGTGLSPLAIQRVLRAHASELGHCYDFARAADPDLRGHGTLELTVDAAGAVTTAQATIAVERGAVLPDTLRDCLAERARHWTFPAPTHAPAQVTAPFRLSAPAR